MAKVIKVLQTVELSTVPIFHTISGTEKSISILIECVHTKTPSIRDHDISIRALVGFTSEFGNVIRN